jgi:hypothetical protein
MRVNSRSPCEPTFKALKILTVAAEYIFSLITLLAHNFEHFTLNSSIHSIYNRRTLQLHRPASNLASHQEGVYVTNIKICILLSGRYKTICAAIKKPFYGTIFLFY